MNVAIIGAGPLGRWLALCAARSDFGVFLEDVMPSTLHHARETIRRQLSAEALGHEHISFVATIEDAVRTADLIIDCVPDELESKLEILWLLDRMAPPQAIFVTPTTQFSIADLSGCTYRPQQCIAIAAEPAEMAAFEPGATIPLRPAAATSAATVEKVAEFWRKAGFVPRILPAD